MKKLVIACITFLLTTVSFSQNPVISEDVLSELMNSENKKVQHIFKDKNSVAFSLVPDTELSKKASMSWSSTDDPKYITENLFYLEKSLLVANSSNPQNCDTSLDAVSRVIRSISKMKGMEYYSNGDKKWETLYHESHCIDNLEDRNPVPDDTEGSADGKHFYCLQKDNSFGNCIYDVDCFQRDNEISVCFTNADNIKYGPILAVKPENLKINIVVIEQDSYYLVYMIVQAKYPNLAFLENRLNRSFNARVDAIYKWFTLSF